MIVKEAPEPTNIIWEHRQFSFGERLVKCLISIVIIVILLAASFSIIILLKKEYLGYLSKYETA